MQTQDQPAQVLADFIGYNRKMSIDGSQVLADFIGYYILKSLQKRTSGIGAHKKSHSEGQVLHSNPNGWLMPSSSPLLLKRRQAGASKQQTGYPNSKSLQMSFVRIKLGGGVELGRTLGDGDDDGDGDGGGSDGRECQ
jgi:hypothetical protein